MSVADELPEDEGTVRVPEVGPPLKGVNRTVTLHVAWGARLALQVVAATENGGFTSGVDRVAGVVAGFVSTNLWSAAVPTGTGPKS
jgi:hypothetical protein